MRGWKWKLGAALLIVPGLLVPAVQAAWAGPQSAPQGTGTGSGSPAANNDSNLFLLVDDLVTATGRGDVLVRFRPQRKPGRLQVTRAPLGVRLTPKAITSSKFCEKIAVANAHNIVVHDIWTRQTGVIEAPEFGEIADVQYDWNCNLIVADMGNNAIGATKPKDGRLWSVAPDGTIRRLGMRHRWSNPAFLEMDEWGTLYVVDKGGGQKRPGSGGWHYDAIYKLGPPRYVFAVKKFNRKGLDVTAFVRHPDGRFFIGNGKELLVLDPSEHVTSVCGPVFSRVNGLAITSKLELFLLDGFDVFGSSKLYRVGPGCDLTLAARGGKIDGSQGLSAGLPAR